MATPRTRTPGESAPSVVPVHARLYVDGEQQNEHVSVEEAVHRAVAEANVVAFIAGDAEDHNAVATIATALGWNRTVLDLVLEDRQRPKLQRLGDSTFVVLRAALYVDEQEDILFSEFHCVLTGRTIVVLRRGVEEATEWSSQTIDPAPTVFAEGAEGLLYGVVNRIVELYAPVIDGVSIDIEQIERQVFGGDDAAPARIYRLGREVVDFEQAVTPMIDVVRAILDDRDLGTPSTSLHDAFAALAERLTHLAESVATLRDQLDRILSVNSTLVAQRQNEAMKRISSWAAILFAPTVVSGIYGMNFHVMPELAWPWGYPLAVGTMLLLAFALWAVFKRRGWL